MRCDILLLNLRHGSPMMLSRIQRFPGDSVTLISEHQDTVIKNLLSEVAELRERVEFLESQFARIPDNILYEVIEIREVGKEEAKAEIMALFEASKGPLYYSEIMEQLGIELELVVEICKELIQEGAIGLDDNAV